MTGGYHHVLGTSGNRTDWPRPLGSELRENPAWPVRMQAHSCCRPQPGRSRCGYTPPGGRGTEFRSPASVRLRHQGNNHRHADHTTAPCAATLHRRDVRLENRWRWTCRGQSLVGQAEARASTGGWTPAVYSRHRLATSPTRHSPPWLDSACPGRAYLIRPPLLPFVVRHNAAPSDGGRGSQRGNDEVRTSPFPPPAFGLRRSAFGVRSSLPFVIRQSSFGDSLRPLPARHRLATCFGATAAAVVPTETLGMKSVRGRRTARRQSGMAGTAAHSPL